MPKIFTIIYQFSDHDVLNSKVISKAIGPNLRLDEFNCDLYLSKHEAFNSIVNFAECENFIETPIKRFSSGMSMKLALSIAIHIPGQIMIFDEIFNYIDYQYKEKVKLFIKEKIISEGKTLILVSHDHDLIKDLCNKVLLLDKGKIKFVGATDEGFNIYRKSSNL